MRKRYNLTCVICGNKFTSQDRKVTHCSRSCIGADPSFRAKMKAGHVGKTGENASRWLGGHIIKNCVVCGKLLTAKNRHTTHCSLRCYWDDPVYRDRMSEIQRKRRPKDSRVCVVCGKSFVVKASKDWKHCSKECALSNPDVLSKMRRSGLDVWKRPGHRAHQSAVHTGKVGELGSHWQGGPVVRNCEVCGKEFSVPKGEAKYRGIVCSRACFGVHHSFTMGGDGTRRSEYGKEFTGTLRRQIRERDGYACRVCGSARDKTLSVHHINYDKKDNRPENLITLCSVCHMKTNFNRSTWLAFFGADKPPIELCANV
jgi:5-methylcytosine-specific restriction endonuclease McrA